MRQHRFLLINAKDGHSVVRVKKISILFVLLVIGLCIWVLLKKEPQPPAPIPTIEINQPVSQQQGTNLIVASSDTNTIAPSQSVTAITNEPFNALTATNLEQWKASVKDLIRLGGIQFHQDWIFEQHKPGGRGADRNSGIPIILSQNGKTITYTATFINLATKNGSDNDLLEAELYSPNMNIDHTRELGLQLCDMLQADPKGFLEWCDKVGNHWLDMPLYGTSGNRHMGFKILNTFNNEKPWCIDFIIQ